VTVRSIPTSTARSVRSSSQSVSNSAKVRVLLQYPVEVPEIGYAFQVMLSSVLEDEA